MDSILFSVMTACEAKDLFTLAHVCTDTRFIFGSKSFWKARFTLLGIQHEEPSLQAYLRCLKIERKFLKGAHSKLVYCALLDLDELEKFDGCAAKEYRKTLRKSIRKAKEAERARKEGNLTVHHYLLRELQSLPLHYLKVKTKKDKYIIFKQKEIWDSSGPKITKEPLLEDLSKTEALNILLRLYEGS